jgi:hypothetical protein
VLHCFRSSRSKRGTSLVAVAVAVAVAYYVIKPRQRDPDVANICFKGADLRSANVTSSGRGSSPYLLNLTALTAGKVTLTGFLAVRETDRDRGPNLGPEQRRHQGE